MFSRFQDYRVLQSVTECYRVLQSIYSASIWTNFWACLMFNVKSSTKCVNVYLCLPAAPIHTYTWWQNCSQLRDYKTYRQFYCTPFEQNKDFTWMPSYIARLHLVIQIQECELLRLVDIPLQESFIPTPRTPISKTKKVYIKQKQKPIYHLQCFPWRRRENLKSLFFQPG